MQRYGAAAKKEEGGKQGARDAASRPSPSQVARDAAAAREGVRAARTAAAQKQQARAVVQPLLKHSRPGVVQRRIPNNAALTTLLSGADGTNNFRRLKKAVRRMNQENRISQDAKNKVNIDLAFVNLDPFVVTPIVNKTFDAVVASDEEASWKLLLESLAKRVPELTYHSPERAVTAPEGVDTARLGRIYLEAMKHLNAIVNTTAHDADLAQVFGALNVATAKVKYGHARDCLRHAYDNGRITTDYHGDDAEVNLGGYALAGTKIHLARSFFTGSENEAIVTLVHESSHLGNGDVLDHGYQGTAMFTQMPEGTKLCNAAHFEEPVRRTLGISHYPGQDFVPAGLGGQLPTHYEQAAREASEMVRRAWTVAFRVLGWMRDIYRYNQTTSPLHFVGTDSLRLVPVGGSTMTESRAFGWVDYWSSVTGMTFHKKTGSERSLTTLDLSLLEGVGRKLAMAMHRVGTASAANGDALPLQLTQTYHRHLLVNHNVNETLRAIGGVRASAVRDLEMVKLMADREGSESNEFVTSGKRKLAK